MAKKSSMSVAGAVSPMLEIERSEVSLRVKPVTTTARKAMRLALSNA
ncbi:MAG: hypothetical protein HKN35_02595 [Woeseia sp.]|nr:hypothetical protein [Woeseia sp.]